MIQSPKTAVMTFFKTSVPKFYNSMKEQRLSRDFFEKSDSRTFVKLSYASYNAHKLFTKTLAPIVIMHGLFGSKNNWNSLAKALNQQTLRQVITIDARNHGESEHSSEMAYSSMAEDVKHLLESLKIKEAVLIGHSMGGAAMMCTALNYPNLVEKLLIVDMSPVKTSPSLHQMTEIINAMLSAKFEHAKTLSEARKQIDKLLSKTIDSPALRQFLLMNVIEVQPGEYKWRVNLPIIAENFASNIAVFPQLIPKLKNRVFERPTLFLAGCNSDYIKHEDHEAIKQIFTSAEFKYVKGAGHWVQSDKPVEFVNLASDFIKKE